MRVGRRPQQVVVDGAPVRVLPEQQDVVLGSEVREDGPPGDVGVRGDDVERRRLVALVQKELQRRLCDALASLATLDVAQRFCGSRSVK